MDHTQNRITAPKPTFLFSPFGLIQKRPLCVIINSLDSAVILRCAADLRCTGFISP